MNNAFKNKSYFQVDMPQNTSAGNQSQSCKEKLSGVFMAIFPSYTFKSFTTFNIILCIVMYVICWAFYLSWDKNWMCTNHYFGSHYGPDVGRQYQFHRLFTPLFLHLDNSHIFFNMIGLAFFGFELEKYYGTVKFMVVYFLSAIGGNLFSILMHYEDFAEGASTSLFGVLAMQCIYVYERKEELKERLKIIVIQLIIILGVNLVESLTKKEIDASSHGGGFVFGGLATLLFVKQGPLSSKRWLKYLSILLMLAGTILMTIMIFKHDAKVREGKDLVPTFEEYTTQKFYLSSDDHTLVTYCSKSVEKKFKDKDEEEKYSNSPV